ncbi:hypothetical protein B4U79_16707 [Dinothrombium tinctorium]|uniref:Ubiquitin-like protease family profile domain-containing protein n=1 Tax=Dinothrombium tinctorium TaxID=1965070 RepID=A0A3S3RK61_9ACAR|nr:hypothetical protein B4U79_16850 [Dinothrombium tinctorium]RWS00872.1 hypothetical protein B4U79_16806 [Dinothrombium tinctorium]RWS01635.1 hypothetical protein B4U79_16708 [Dinothrombium tinctorium]RWS01636.1 hypothetical protein B4U79_16707 [Dinothrombium tinctorium]
MEPQPEKSRDEIRKQKKRQRDKNARKQAIINPDTKEDEDEQAQLKDKIKLVEAQRTTEEHQAKKFKACLEDAVQPFPDVKVPIEPILDVLNQSLLDEEQNDAVDKIWKYSGDDKIIVEDFSITITGHDIKTLIIDENRIGWLNDNVIDFYLQLIAKSTTNNNLFVYPSIFHRTLTDRYQDALKFKRRQQNLHQFNLYLMPIILKEHWTLLFYNPDFTKIYFFNYMTSYGPEPTPILNRTRRYFTKLFEKRGGNWTEPSIDDQTVPQQTNESDCGVYVCYFARCLASNHPLEVTTQQIKHFRKQIAYEISTKTLINKLF